MLPLNFYLPALSALAAIVLGTFYAVPPSLWHWLLLLAFGCALLWRRFGYGAALTCTLVLLAATAGFWRIETTQQHIGTTPLLVSVEQPLTLTGTIVRDPEVRETTQHIYVELESGDIILAYVGRTLPLAYGDTVELAGELQTPEPFATDLGRTFQYPGYLLARGVELVMVRPEVTVLEHGGGNLLVRNLLSFKTVFDDSLKQLLPEPARGLGVGLLLGEKAALSEELETVFRRTGIIHIVVLSGYNVMLVVSFVIFALSFLLPPRPRVCVALGAIACFALLVGLSATVVRASIMAALFLAAHALGRSYAVTRALILAAVVMVFLNPYLLVYDVGFQLSFLATLGLALLAPHFEANLTLAPATLGIRSFLVATVVAQISVLPLLLYQIGELSLIAVLVNLLVLPAVPLAMFLTFVCGMAGLVSPFVGSMLAFPAYLVLEYILTVATLGAAIPFAAVAVPAFSFWWVVVGYALLSGWVWWLTKKTSGAASFEAAPPVASGDTPIFFR